MLFVVAALAATPVAVASAAGTSTGFGTVPTQQVPEPLQTPEPAPTGDTGVSSGQLALMALGAVVLLAGIWVVIMRDARRRVPERKRQRDANST